MRTYLHIHLNNHTVDKEERRRVEGEVGQGHQAQHHHHRQGEAVVREAHADRAGGAGLPGVFVHEEVDGQEVGRGSCDATSGSAPRRCALRGCGRA